ncbi:MAG: septal ring lytic transglycosylase RlpA family protein, partial [Coleofasciculus sp. S288]|nr:septal ring lytic transglycosylase RlpA family protein [Coleofasciculus sp. S288]
VIAKIHAHEVAGRQAATLFVRNIPVLTFLGSSPVSTNEIKMGEAVASQKSASGVSTLESTASGSNASIQITQPNGALNANAIANDPVWRATTVAARLNQLNLENVEAEAIAVKWQSECNCYSIKANDEELVQINENTILPDTTRNPAEDALQATNRLRRLMGNAPPLREIVGRPPARTVAQLSLGPLRVQISGIASWYGPGFHGRRSASGERYNQNELTAAHRSLPFGTNVQVTNLNNGRSVVVRINDRGPFVRGRVIDLSAAAARVLGLIQSGIAPVRIEVLEAPRTTMTEY